MTDVTAPPTQQLDLAIGFFSRTRHHNSRLLDAIAAKWSVAASDIRAIYYLTTQPDVTPKQMADYLGITTGAMTSMVDRIERAGLAKRMAHPTDRRSIVVALTERGQEAVADALGRYRSVFSAVVDESDLPWVSEFFEGLATRLASEADLVSGRGI